MSYIRKITASPLLAGVSIFFFFFPTVVAGREASLSTKPAPGLTRQANRLHSSYILGVGDSLLIELLNLPELAGTFTIGPDGTLYIPRLRALYVEGLTVQELEYFLKEQFKVYIKDPQVFITPINFRSVRVYVGGDVSRPGYYTLSSEEAVKDDFNLGVTPGPYPSGTNSSLSNNSSIGDLSPSMGVKSKLRRWPTLFDALRAAQGVTPYSDLSDVKVVRKQPISQGGGKAQAKINFLELVTLGNESVNIRLFDGDFISVGRSELPLRDQLVAASRTNLSPDFIEIFVSGRVKEPGPKTLPQGATLNQAIASAGGPQLLRGGVEFVRFNPDGATDRRQFSYKPSAKAGEFKNPILMSGDVVRVNDSLFSAGVNVLNEITGPAVGIYSIYSLFKP